MFAQGCGRSGDPGGLDAREKLALQLAQAIPETWTQDPIVVIANPYIHKRGIPPDVRAYHKACMAGLAAGLGRSIKKDEIVFPDLKEGAWEKPESFLLGRHTTTPLSHLMTPDALDRIRAQHPKARLFISVVGLPSAFSTTPFWQDNASPALALYLPDFSVIPDLNAWVHAFYNDRVVVAVQQKPGTDEAVIINASNAADYFFKSR